MAKTAAETNAYRQRIAPEERELFEIERAARSAGPPLMRSVERWRAIRPVFPPSNAMLAPASGDPKLASTVERKPTMRPRGVRAGVHTPRQCGPPL
jgi:hypothetical protein